MTTEAAATIAEPSHRLVARIIDTLIVGVPVTTAATALFPRQTAQTVVAPLAFAGLSLVYEVVQLAVWGRTVGKRLTGIRVASAADGGRPAPLQALVRAAIYTLPSAVRPVPILNALAGIFWIGEIGLLFEGAYRQALHDRAAGTLVVRDRLVAGGVENVEGVESVDGANDAVNAGGIENADGIENAGGADDAGDTLEADDQAPGGAPAAG